MALSRSRSATPRMSYSRKTRGFSDMVRDDSAKRGPSRGAVRARSQVGLQLAALELGDDRAHVLGPLAGTDQQRVLGLDHDQVLHADERDHASGRPEGEVA